MGRSSCSWPDKKLSKKLVKELVQGRDLANQLQNLLLHRAFGGHGSVSVPAAGELAAKILSSFTETLSVLSATASTATTPPPPPPTTSTTFDLDLDHDRNNVVLSQIDVPDVPFSHLDQSQCGDRGSEDSVEISTKKRTALKDRRGCYNRRKSSQSWTKVTSKIEDGQAWRKYGQKDILHAPYPRAYFRCTRKYDQGCRATKQVQQIQDNPKLYKSTYIGQHTCKNILKGPQMIISDDCDQQYPWDFANNMMVGSDQSSKSTTTATTTTTTAATSSTIIPNSSESAATKLMKQDHDQVKKETPSDDQDDHDNASLDTDDHTSLWPDEFKDLELADPTIGLLTSTPKVGSDNDIEDVVSHHVMFPFEAYRTAGTTAALDLDPEDFVMKSIDFGDNYFQFSET